MKTFWSTVALGVFAFLLLCASSASATSIESVSCSPIPSQGVTQYDVDVNCSVRVSEVEQGAWFDAYLQDCNTFCGSIGRANVASPDGYKCTSGEERPWSAINAGVNYGPTGCWHTCSLPEGRAGAVSVGPFCYTSGQKHDNDRTDLTVGCYCAKTTAAPQMELGININPLGATQLQGVSGIPSNFESVTSFVLNDRPERIFDLHGVVGYGRTATLSMNINVKGSCGTSAALTAVLGRADGTYQNRGSSIALPSCPPIPQCADGVDNDRDGAVDLADFSCSSTTDNDEANPKSQCQDGIDNDSDGLVDLNDPGCTSNQGNSEGAATSECQDGVDNDGDGAQDYPADFSCSSRTDKDETNPKAQCQDGVDNDSDGAADLADFSCSSEQDNDEANPKSQCQDGIDNDSDGLVDMNDPGCTNNQGNNEGSATAQCRDGIDNDGDGAVDFPADFSCTTATDKDETNPKAQCQDGIDNDNDGATDSADFSCSGAQDNDESNPKSQCQDGIDNDSDGLIDLNDPGCTNNQGNNEGSGTAQCQDGVDNDGDGATDFPADFSCSSATDKDEANPKSQCQDNIDNDNDGATDLADFSCSGAQDNDETNPKSQCQDGLDNDSDGLVDMNDPGCTSSQGNNEAGATAQCRDGVDNDGDGATDFPADFSCSGPTDTDETNPKSQCQNGIDDDGDGAVDFPADFSCQTKQDNDEATPKSQCQDGVDNDSDGLVDSNDPGCSGGQDNNEGDETAKVAVGVECVMDNSDGSKTAYFSYNNATSQPIDVPVSATGTTVNSFSPGLPDQGQPSIFLPGVVKGAVGVPLGSSGVTWTVRAAGSAQSTATASAASPKCQAILPQLECQGYDNGQLRAKGGYTNANPFDVTFNFGALNFFSPGSSDQGQPSRFKSGLNKASFSVVLTDPATQLVWDLNGRKASASNSLPVCDGECINTSIGEVRGELDDLALQISQLTIDAANVLAAAAGDNASGAAAGSARASKRRRAAQIAAAAVDAERAKAKANSYLQQSNALTIQFPDVVKNCPEAPQYCETVDRGPTIDQLRALFVVARNQAQRTIARAYYRQTGATNRKDQLVAQAKALEAQGIADLNQLPRTETVCK